MNTPTIILETLPGVKIEDIKDGARKIAPLITNEKGIGDKIGANLRILLSPEAKKESIDTEILGAILRLMRVKRDHIINLLQAKECIKKVVGASKREEDARVKLADQVLDEIEGKICSYLIVHNHKLDDGSVPVETPTTELFRNARCGGPVS